MDLERERAELERTRVELERHRPVYDAGIRFAEMAIRSLLILNGGATLALFAIAGNADKVGLKPKVPELSLMALIFGIGAAAAVTTAFFSYLAQTAYVEGDPEDQGRKWGNFFRALAVATGVGSMVAFAASLWRSLYLF